MMRHSNFSLCPFSFALLYQTILGKVDVRAQDTWLPDEKLRAFIILFHDFWITQIFFFLGIHGAICVG